MGMQKMVINPGVSSQATETLNKGSWSQSNLIRFRDGYLEKLMGWTHLTTETVLGVIRTLWSWLDLSGIKYLAIGASAQLGLYTSGLPIFDITPLRATVDVAVDFSTTSGSNVVTIKDVAHGCITGDVVEIVTTVSVGGLLIVGTYMVTVIDDDNYTIEAASNATATVSHGGAVSVFATTNTSAIVGVILANHGYVVGDIYDVQVSTTVATVVINGQYLVNTVIDADHFTIVAASSANATTTGAENGGNVRINYLLSPGASSSTVGIGWGSGSYGTGTWGYGGGTPTEAVNPIRFWWLDNFGENLVAAPTNGTLYEWLPPAAVGNRATAVSAAPDYMIGMFVAMPQAQVIALGAEVLGVQDPLLVRWCDNGDYTDWTASATNQAGSYRLSRGSAIIGGLQGPQASFIWTDTDIWQMQYVGTPFVYSFTQIAAAGLIGSHAACVLGRDIYWMSLLGFYKYGAGSVQPIPCAVWDIIFAAMDLDDVEKIIAAPNTHINEVAWYFVSSESETDEIDSYVKFNTITQTWDYGSLCRTAWSDNNLFGPPLGADENGIIQQHETGYNNDGQAMTGVMAQTGFSDIADGTDFVFIDEIIPDFKLQGDNASLEFTVYTTDYPNEDVVTHGPYTITASTKIITDIRARARQVAFKVSSDAIDMWWRLGAVRLRTSGSGKR